MALIGLVFMLISCSDVSFKELKLIVIAECVIFSWSLIGATMQDGSKRERRNDDHSMLELLYFISIFSFYLFFLILILIFS